MTKSLTDIHLEHIYHSIPSFKAAIDPLIGNLATAGRTYTVSQLKKFSGDSDLNAEIALLFLCVASSGKPASDRRRAYTNIFSALNFGGEDKANVMMKEIEEAYNKDVSSNGSTSGEYGLAFNLNAWTVRFLMKLMPLSSVELLCYTQSAMSMVAAIMGSKFIHRRWYQLEDELGFSSDALHASVSAGVKDYFAPSGGPPPGSVLQYIIDVKNAYLTTGKGQDKMAQSVQDAIDILGNLYGDSTLSVLNSVQMGAFLDSFTAPTAAKGAPTVSVTTNLSPAALAAAHAAKAAAVNPASVPFNPAPATQGDSTMAQSDNTALTINPAVEPIIDSVLASTGLNITIKEMISKINMVPELQAKLTGAEKMAADTISDLQAKLHQAKSSVPSFTLAPVATGIPSGKCNQVDADSIFPEMKGFTMSIPHFTWDAPHPDVPEINPDYIFRKEMLFKALRCLIKGENLWLQGHTGAGKTTFIEQIAARMGWPVARIAFDSNVDRSELVGRMQLVPDGKGGTASEWISGILERAMKGNYILLCDEIDAGHPNSLYVLQPILEGKPLSVLEDGGRIVNRQPMFRMVATGNTTGNGDPSGMYPACRILSAATLDRFPEFISVPYMTLDEETHLISKSAPTLSKTLVAKLAKFGAEMRAAFVKLETPITYSPRRSIAFARAVEDFSAMSKMDQRTIMSLVFKSKLYDAAPDEHRQRLVEIAKATLVDIDPAITL